MPEQPKLEACSLTPKQWDQLRGLLESGTAKIAENIADANTDAMATRSITIKITYSPESDRRASDVTIKQELKLASIGKQSSRIYSGKGEDNKNYLFDRDPRQDILFSPPQEKENLLDFKSQSAGS